MESNVPIRGGCLRFVDDRSPTGTPVVCVYLDIYTPAGTLVSPPLIIDNARTRDLIVGALNGTGELLRYRYTATCPAGTSEYSPGAYLHLRALAALPTAA